MALLHRRSSDEWRLPKGKVHPGETLEQGAQREVAEEVGLPVALGPCLGETHYTYAGGAGSVRKRVVYYLARLDSPRPLTPEAPTFDRAEWVPSEEALRLLTWDTERNVVLLALAVAVREDELAPSSGGAAPSGQ